MSLDSLAASSLGRSIRWFPAPHQRGVGDAILHMALGVAGETGEIVEIIKKLHQDGKVSSLADSGDRDLGHEIVDVITYCLNLAALCGVNLDLAFDQKVEICEERYQKRLTGGRG